jgi:NADH:ubiquinone oxidoreductase subunit E
MSTTTDNLSEVQEAARAALGQRIVGRIEQLDAVAQLMQIPAAKVAGVASFYHYFRLKPRGKFLINICLGTACYVKGADRVAQRLMDELGISWGETSSDGMFTLEGARCLGTCGLAPVVMINEEVHASVTPDEIPVILQKYLKQARDEAQ